MKRIVVVYLISFLLGIAGMSCKSGHSTAYTTGTHNGGPNAENPYNNPFTNHDKNLRVLDHK